MGNKCKKHNIDKCYDCLNDAVKELLTNTLAAGNGGFIAEFGLVLYSKLAIDTNFK